MNAKTGQFDQQLSFDEFGNVLQDTSPGRFPFNFAGCLYDQDTKLCHFGAREYDPETGRWMQRDPILFAGGDTNLYGYVLNDPVNFTDPSGLRLSDVNWRNVFGGAFLAGGGVGLIAGSTGAAFTGIGAGLGAIGGVAGAAAVIGGGALLANEWFNFLKEPDYYSDKRSPLPSTTQANSCPF